MKNSLKNLLGISALALLLVATPVFAAEVEVSGENATTGADSTNRNTDTINNDVNATVTNVGDVDNTADADVNTGGNTQDRNTTGGELESGAVDASTDWESVLNAGAALMGASDDGLVVGADFSNDTTGADSDNRNTLTVNHDVDHTLTNVADIMNSLTLDANTGDNEQTRNTTAGDLMTGDVSVDSMIGNWANNDAGMAGAGDSETSVDVMASNHRTGADSTNRNDVTVNNDLTVNHTNVADIANEVNVSANTGGNTQDRNTTAGGLETGSVEVATEVENRANNGTGGSHGGHGLDVTVDASNDTTGADSDNRNTTTVNHDVTANVTNDADVANELNVDANTGDNEQNRNTEGGDIQTGDVSISFGVNNEVNSN
jgi:hypothetical protein